MRIILFLISITFSQAVFAESIKVRTGQHDGYVRFAFDVAPFVELSVSQSGNSIELVFEKSEDGFDISSVFDRIGRDIVLSIEILGTSRLKLTTSCQCKLSNFRASEKMIVLDVSDQEKTLEVKYEGDNILPVILPRMDHDRHLWPTLEHSAGGNETSHSERQKLLTSEARLRIVSDLLADTGQWIEGVELSTGNETKRLVTELPKARTPSHLASDVSQTPLIAESCLSSDVLEVSAWFPSVDDAISSIARASIDLFDASGKPRANAVDSIARAHIYLGFGVEAENVLFLRENQDEHAKLLLAMAHVLQNQGEDATMFLEQPEDCIGQVALWRFLATEDSLLFKQSDLQNIRISLRTLPAHLREFLSERAIEKFGEYGQKSVALAIKADIEAGHKFEAIQDREDHSPEFEKSQTGNTKTGVSEGFDELSDVVALVEAVQSEGGHVDIAHVEFLESYMRQTTEEGSRRKLLRAVALANAQTSDFETALNRAAELEAVGPVEYRKTLGDILVVALARMNDKQLVDLAINFQPLAQDTPAFAVHALANRLLDLGFPEPARDWLSNDLDEPVQRDRRLLRGRAYLDMRRPRLAEIELLGLQGKHVDVLRAEARYLAGDFHVAAALFEKAGELDQASAAKFLANIELVDQDSTASAPQEPLAGAQYLLDQSAIFRNQLERLVVPKN